MIRRRALSALAIVLAVFWIFPVYWMLNSSLLPVEKARTSNPSFVPVGGSFDGYKRVLTPEFWASMRLSLSVTLIVVVVALLFAFLAALAVSRFKFLGRKGFVLTILIVQMIPAEALFISQYKVLQGWGLLNSILGLSILYTAAVLPFTVWMLRGFVDGVPKDLEQAAQIDGCTPTGAFFRITFPLLAPGLVASGVYAFLQAWNEFTLATVVMSPSNKTLPLWLRGLAVQSNQAVDWPAVMAGAVLVALPVVIFFMLVQGRMTSGLVSGAVKG